MADLEDLEEEQMLMKAIAMSLEEEEELCSVKGELLIKKSTGQKEGGYLIKQDHQRWGYSTVIHLKKTIYDKESANGYDSF